MAYISKGLTLGFTGQGAGAGAVTAYLTDIASETFPNLQEIGEISFNGAGGSYDQIEVTTLADSKHVYTDGLIADDENSGNEITFKFLYDPDLFKLFKDVMDAEGESEDDTHNTWVVKIPEGGTFTITGDIASLKMDTVSTNSALTFVLAIAVREIAVA